MTQRLRHDEMKVARAEQIIGMKLNDGLSNVEIAKKLNIHHDTVSRSLSWAKKAGLFVKFDDEVLQDVVPAAIAALKIALADGDGELAIKVLEKTLWLQQNPQKNQHSPTAQSADGDGDLTAYIAQLRNEAQKAEDATADSIDAELSPTVGLLEAENAK